MAKQFLHNSAGAIDIPVLHEKAIKNNLWKQRNQNELMPLKHRKKFQPSVSFNLNDTTRIRSNLPRRGALNQLQYFQFTGSNLLNRV